MRLGSAADRQENRHGHALPPARDHAGESESGYRVMLTDRSGPPGDGDGGDGDPWEFQAEVDALVAAVGEVVVLESGSEQQVGDGVGDGNGELASTSPAVWVMAHRQIHRQRPPRRGGCRDRRTMT